MKEIVIYSESDFNKLATAFTGEIDSDCNIALEVIEVDEEQIKRLNNEFRQVDSITDVLSFPTLNGILGKKLLKKEHKFDIDENGNLFLGSIAICTKRAEEQAREYNHSYERELNYLITHGICHLLGYDHIDEADKAKMREKEEKILKKLNLTR